MSNMNQLSQLEKEIERLREEMVKQATEKGRISDESITVSQKLDRLINEYLQLQSKQKEY